MIVADTNLIGYLFLTGEFSAQAEQVYRKDSEWAAPVLWRSEFCNVLRMYLRKNLISLETASTIMSEATQFMAGSEYAVDSLDVLNLAARSLCSAYDCEFVALAQDLTLPLVTNDQKLLAQFPKTALSLERFLLL